jgi:zinc transport system permease protein
VTLFEYLAIPAILRGFFGLLIAGTFFPVAGIYVLRFNLYTFRFTIMHAVILAGAAALVLHIDLLLAGLVGCVVVTLLLAPLSRVARADTGMMSAFFMIMTMAAAVTVMYRAGVAAKDTLEILWGNIYAMTNTDLVFTLAFAFVPCGFTVVFYRQITCLVFDRDIAYTSGVNEKALMNAIMVIIGMTIAFIMRLVGALLLDAVLLLPALAASGAANSFRSFFVLSMGIGCFSAVAGFVVSILSDIPASAGVSLVAGGMFIVFTVIKQIKGKRKVSS